jgi:outer membrane protein TolC
VSWGYTMWRGFWLATCVVAGLSSAAPKGINLSLNEAILLALRYSPDIKNAEIDRVTQKFALRVAKYQFEVQPVLGATGTYGKQTVDGENFPATGYAMITPGAKLKLGIGTQLAVEVPIQTNTTALDPGPNVALNFKLTQPLLRGFGTDITLAQLHKAYDDELGFKLDLKNNVITVVTTVISDYLDVVRNQTDLSTRERAISDQQKTLRDNTAKVKAGQLPRTVNVEAESQLASLQLELTSAQNSLRAARYKLLRDLGLSPTLPIIVQSEVPLGKLTVPNVDEAIKKAFKSNINYQKKLLQIKKNKRDLNVAKDAQRWELNAVVSSAVGSTTAIGTQGAFGNILDGRNQAHSVGLGLSVPIRDLPRQQQLVNAQVAVEKDKIALMDEQRGLEIQVRNAVADLATQIDQLKLSAHAIQLAYESYQLELKKQALGLATSLDVTTSQNKYIQVQTNNSFIKASYLRSVAQLQQLLATTLDEWDIKLKY